MRIECFQKWLRNLAFLKARSSSKAWFSITWDQVLFSFLITCRRPIWYFNIAADTENWNRWRQRTSQCLPPPCLRRRTRVNFASIPAVSKRPFFESSRNVSWPHKERLWRRWEVSWSGVYVDYVLNDLLEQSRIPASAKSIAGFIINAAKTQVSIPTEWGFFYIAQSTGHDYRALFYLVYC